MKTSKKKREQFRSFDIEKNVLDLWKLGLYGEHLTRALLQRVKETSDYIVTPGSGIKVRSEGEGHTIEMYGWRWEVPDWAKAKIRPEFKPEPEPEASSSTKAFCEKCGELKPVRLIAEDIPLLLPIGVEEVTHLCLYECLTCRSWALMPGKVAGVEVNELKPSASHRAPTFLDNEMAREADKGVREIEARARNAGWWHQCIPALVSHVDKGPIPKATQLFLAQQVEQEAILRQKLAMPLDVSMSSWAIEDYEKVVGKKGGEGQGTSRWTGNEGWCLGICPNGHDTIACYVVPNRHEYVDGIEMRSCMTCEEYRFRSARAGRGFWIDVRGSEPKPPDVEVLRRMGGFAWMKDGTLRCPNNHMWVLHEHDMDKERSLCLTCRASHGAKPTASRPIRFLYMGNGRKLNLNCP